MGRVEGRVALVTGAALGIGRATAELLAREGAIVAVTDVLDDDGEDVVESIRSQGGQARYWHLYASDGIRVNSVHPGFVRTPMVEGYVEGQDNEDAAWNALNQAHPLGHIGEPDDVAYAILYLASDESSFVTGTELIVDGGYTAR